MAKGLSLADFKSDETAETEGVWIDYESGLRLKIARFGNKRLQDYIRRKRESGKRMYKNGIDSVGDEEAIKLMAKYILLDWENLKDEDGKELEYTEENAIKALQIRDFREEVLELSMDRENYRTERIENASKN